MSMVDDSPLAGIVAEPLSGPVRDDVVADAPPEAVSTEARAGTARRRAEGERVRRGPVDAALVAGGALWFYLTLEALRPLPLSWTARCLRFAGRCKYLLRPAERRHALEWLEKVAPEAREPSERRRLAQAQLTHAVLRRYLSFLLMLRDARRCESLLQIDGWEHLERALVGNRGAVLLSSHVGLPRILRWVLRSRDLDVMYLLRIGFETGEDRSLKARFQRWHRRHFHLEGEGMVEDADLSVQYMKKAYQHLRRNGLVNVAGDGSFGEHRFPVTICGREYSFASGGMALGRMSGAAILPCFTSADPAPRFRVEIQEPLTCPEGLPREAQLRQLTEAYASRIEGYVRRHPTNVVVPPYTIRF